MPVIDPGLVEIIGSETSAAGVAAAISGTKCDSSVQELLKVVRCGDLPYDLQADTQLWSALQADTEAAVKAGRVAFTYVDLTAKQVLPSWLPADAVGGKSMAPEDAWDLSKGGNTVAQLGASFESSDADTALLPQLGAMGSCFLALCSGGRCHRPALVVHSAGPPGHDLSDIRGVSPPRGRVHPGRGL